jgi:hypothetical protein
MKKNIILSVLFFGIGFLTHAFFFPDMLSNGIADVSNIVIPNTSPTPQDQGSHSFMTEIDYNEGHFSRHNITVDIGSYVLITNQSKNHLMWLISNNPLLATVRGYGESEKVRVRLDTKGQYVVGDKNAPQERLVITVK